MREISASAYDVRTESMNAFFRRVYHWMAVGLILTAIVAHWVASSPELLAATANSMWILILLELGLVLALSAGINKLSATAAMVMFVLYSLLNGATLSVVLWAYTGESVFSAFLTTTGMFGAMSVYGLCTGRDLSSWRSFLIMGLVGLVIAGIVNMFVGNGVADLAISAIGVLVFLGLTAYDTQKLRDLGGQVDVSDVFDSRPQKLAIIGALRLYLDFVNLFLYLLRFMGKRRN
jgi:FtsH-binding integral membrane protein